MKKVHPPARRTLKAYGYCVRVFLKRWEDDRDAVRSYNDTHSHPSLCPLLLFMHHGEHTHLSRRQGLVDCHLGVEKGVCERLHGARPLVPLWVEQQSQQVPARAAGAPGVEQLHPSHATDAQPVVRIQVLA